jgi:hypothetical protein
MINIAKTRRGIDHCADRSLGSKYSKARASDFSPLLQQHSMPNPPVRINAVSREHKRLCDVPSPPRSETV